MGDGTETLWARVELMGHALAAGRLSHNSEFGAIQLDIPLSSGGFATELYGPEAVFRIKFITEQMARALAIAFEKNGDCRVLTFDVPLMLRSEHDIVVAHLRAQVIELERALEDSHVLRGAQQVALLPDMAEDRREGWAQTSTEPYPPKDEIPF